MSHHVNNHEADGSTAGKRRACARCGRRAAYATHDLCGRCIDLRLARERKSMRSKRAVLRAAALAKREAATPAQIDFYIRGWTARADAVGRRQEA